MSETLTLEDKSVAERLAEVSPDTHEAMKSLPPHIIEHVGSLALKLTHIDMHPVTVTEYQGKTYKEADYTRRVLDSEDLDLEFEHSAIEAAKAGEEKLAKVLHASSATLALAHAVLVSKGYSFEAPEGESEEDRSSRQAKEKADLATAAYHISAARAIELKRSGNQSALLEQLESLHAIAYLGGNKYGDKPLQRTYRHLIHEGLAEDIITSLQTAREIGVSSYEKLDSPASMQKSILQLATGKKIDYDFSITGDLDFDRLDRIDGSDPMVEVTAVITSPHINMPEATRRKILEKMTNWGSQPALKEKLDKLGSYSEGGAFYDLAEECAKEKFGDSLREVLEVDDPIAFKNYADKLGVSLIQAMRIITKRSKEDYRTRYLDAESADSLITISEKYPEVFKTIIDKSLTGEAKGGYGLLLSSLDTLIGAGLSLEQLKGNLVNSSPEDLGLLTKSILHANEYAKKKSLSQEEFFEKMSHSDLGENFYWALVTIAKQIEENPSEATGRDVAREFDTALDEIMVDSTLSKSYRSIYEEVHYPLSPESVKKIRLGLDSFPEIDEQLQGLGIDPALAKDIFASWATYNALQKHGYDDDAGFVTIKEKPVDDGMSAIVRDQVRSIKTQLESLKKFHAEYGEQELKEIISIFGIYNFSRHNPASLHDQLVRWKDGVRAETVVAEARADWNSYTGKLTKFEDESAKPGVFYFEVNSPLELSRLAVSVGQRERASGREPDIKRFIVHAHGNPTGLLLGVNGERLLTSHYTDAVNSRGKLPVAESNDYRRHLGPNYSVILQSCSGAGETIGKNIASTMADQLGSPVTGAVDTITGLVIKADGTVEYEAGYKETTEAITY